MLNPITKPLDEHLILRRLMWPLVITFIFLTIMVSALMWWQHDYYQEENLNQKITDISTHFEENKTQQIAIMSSLLEVISANSMLREALQARDRDRLLALSQQPFEFMRKGGISHFYFQDTDRNNILRVQFPDKIGGHIDRFTIREAERTGKTVGGLELGSFGLLTLRVVHPVFSDDKLIGYVELGQGIDNLLETQANNNSYHLAVSIHKSILKRDAWQTGMKLRNKEANWDRFPQDVISFSSLSRLPDELMNGHLKNHNRDHHGQTDLAVTHNNDRVWQVGFSPIIDAAGQDVGDLTVMIDITSLTTAFQRTLTSAATVVAAILTLLILLIYKLLSKTDQHLVSQQNKIDHAKIQQQAIFNVVIDGLILIDKRGRIEICNPAAEAIFGYPGGELLGQNVDVLMPEPYHSNHDGYLQAYTQGGEAKIIGIGREVKGKRKDGTVFPLELAVAETFIDGQKQFVGVVRDITARKQAEETLTHAKEAAEQASRAKSAFLSSMSHELRTPLNAVLGFGQLLQLNSKLDTTSQEYVQAIMKGGQHLLTLVNEVLDLAKIESEQLNISFESVELSNVIEDCFSVVETLAAERNVQLSHINPADFAVRADPIRLKQVLLNLLSNAIKYNRKAGKVHLDISPVANHQLRISVTDTGHGIPNEKFDELFEPFNRLGEEVGTIEGSGLGLTITLRMTEMMEGMLGVESEVGVGSCFWIELPQALESQSV